MMKISRSSSAWGNVLLLGALWLGAAGLLLFGSGAAQLKASATLTQMGYSILLALSLNLVVGFLGELSLGHAGFMCVGAYVGGALVNLLYEAGVPKLLATLLALLAGGAAAALLGLVIGAPTLRLKGDYLAIVTLGFGEIVRNLFANLFPQVFGGPSGLTVQKFGPKLCLLTLGAALAALVLIQNLMNSKHGRAIMAIRDNEIAAGAVGVNIASYKLIAFVLAAFFAGAAGLLFGQHVGILRPSKFDFNYSINILVMVVLGGMGNLRGSMVAAAALTLLDIQLADTLSGDLAVVKNLVYALILILAILWNNAPKLQPWRERCTLANLSRKLRSRFLGPHRAVPEGGFAKPRSPRWDKVASKVPMDSLLSTELTPESAGPDRPRKQNQKGGLQR